MLRPHDARTERFALVDFKKAAAARAVVFRFNVQHMITAFGKHVYGYTGRQCTERAGAVDRIVKKGGFAGKRQRIAGKGERRGFGKGDFQRLDSGGFPPSRFGSSPLLVP